MPPVTGKLGVRAYLAQPDAEKQKLNCALLISVSVDPASVPFGSGVLDGVPLSTEADGLAIDLSNICPTS